VRERERERERKKGTEGDIRDEERKASIGRAEEKESGVTVERVIKKIVIERAEFWSVSKKQEERAEREARR